MTTTAHTITPAWDGVTEGTSAANPITVQTAATTIGTIRPTWSDLDGVRFDVDVADDLTREHLVTLANALVSIAANIDPPEVTL